MARVEAKLEPDERVLLRTGLHPMAFAGAASLALFVLLIVVLLIRHNELPGRVDAQIALVGGLVAALGATPSVLRWLHTAVVLTDRRVLVSAGGFRRRELVVPLGPGVLEQESGLAGRVLDYGTVSVAAPDGRMSSLGHVAHARELVEVARAQARRPSRGRAGRG